MASGTTDPTNGDDDDLAVLEAELATEDQPALLRRLILEVRGAGLRVKDLGRDLHRANNRWTAVVVVGGVLAVALTFGIVRSFQIRSADQAERRERSHGSCVLFNVEQEGDRIGAKRAIVDAFAGDPAHLTDVERDAYERFAAAIDAANPYRDCSDQGITEDLENPPADPAIDPHDDPLECFAPTPTTAPLRACTGLAPTGG